MKSNYLLIFCFLVVINSCENANQESNITMHPISEYMPYSNINSEVLDEIDGGEYLDQLPKNVQALYRFLNYETDDADTHELNLLTSDAIDVSTINESDLLILDKDSNRLIQYNLLSDEYEVIANQGRGPGDLFFSRELSVYDDKAIVAMQGFRISVFMCSDGYCDYDKTIQTDYNNYSTATIDDHLYFLGIAPFGREQDPDPVNTNQQLVHKINFAGEKQHSFLPVYNFRAPVVRERMHSEGHVRTFPESGTIIVTFELFPYIYMHDIAGELTAKYKLPGFIQNYYEYEEDNSGRWRGRIIYDSNSRISFTSELDNRWLLLKIREQRDVEFIDLIEGFKGDEWHSYYIFDVNEEKLFKIGDDIVKPYNESRVIFVSDQGLIINKEGTLYFVEK